ncbi:uncharacterized protein K452DRAFT_313236 [Aplosporella prunicola CBS 121167]|uniref:Uncharacterized protein n=1 Tax=Aplosporella prunicola CBS 121167 TaxID=1176127 RepID=A0A6A6AX92_9PEZI|nr:uncharacterized protein K452DRAFT_313236 [Aplosporella prunicola CBS 121167]KAF2136370.1 hypothetical protein K452DRAFT_313236 [Aplosporella prunicola CBS 121167]
MEADNDNDMDTGFRTPRNRRTIANEGNNRARSTLFIKVLSLAFFAKLALEVFLCRNTVGDLHSIVNFNASNPLQPIPIVQLDPVPVAEELWKEYIRENDDGLILEPFNWTRISKTICQTMSSFKNLREDISSYRPKDNMSLFLYERLQDRLAEEHPKFLQLEEALRNRLEQVENLDKLAFRDSKYISGLKSSDLTTLNQGSSSIELIMKAIISYFDLEDVSSICSNETLQTLVLRGDTCFLGPNLKPSAATMIAEVTEPGSTLNSIVEYLQFNKKMVDILLAMKRTQIYKDIHCLEPWRMEEIHEWYKLFCNKVNSVTAIGAWLLPRLLPNSLLEYQLRKERIAEAYNHVVRIETRRHIINVVLKLAVKELQEDLLSVRETFLQCQHH